MMIRSMPPASAHFALMPGPAPPPMIGLPEASCVRKRCRHSSRVKKLKKLALPHAEDPNFRQLRFHLEIRSERRLEEYANSVFARLSLLFRVVLQTFLKACVCV